MLSAAKEERLSPFSDLGVFFPLAAFEGVGENSHQGITTKNPTLHRGSTEVISTTALGMRPVLRWEGVRSRYTGKQHDDESNLDDFDARYYSPQWGRFISADWSAVPAPVPYANFTNPQTLNLYAIVADNPGTFVDLDGHILQLAGDISADESAIRGMAGSFDQYLGFSPCGKNTCVSFDPPSLDRLSPEAMEVYDWVKSPNLFVFSVKPLGKNAWAVDLNSTISLFGHQFYVPAGSLFCSQGHCAQLYASTIPIIPEGEALKALASARQVEETGKSIIGAGVKSSAALRDADRLAAQYGGEAKDWAKMTSSNFKSADKTMFETHWYQNAVTGAKVEYKTALYYLKGVLMRK